MADASRINSAQKAQQSVPFSNSQAAESAAKLPKAPAATASTQATTFSSNPDSVSQVHSKVVSRLLEQNASIYGPGLARIPLPARSNEAPRTAPKKPAGPMVSPRSLNGGSSPLAPTSLFDARASLDSLGELPGSATGQSADDYWNDRFDTLSKLLDGGTA